MQYTYSHDDNLVHMIDELEKSVDVEISTQRPSRTNSIRQIKVYRWTRSSNRDVSIPYL